MVGTRSRALKHPCSRIFNDATVAVLIFTSTNHGIAMLELPRIPNYASSATQFQSHNVVDGSYTKPTTSLPSFASFQEHASRSDDADEVEIAPMSSRLSCYMCSKLKPMVRDVAIAVGELDENVQTVCQKPVTRVRVFTRDGPVN